MTSAVPLRRAHHNRLFVIASDYKTGALRQVDLTTGQMDCAVVPVHADATLRFDRMSKQVVVINRLAGNHLSLVSIDDKRVLNQIPLAENTNPQDVSFLGDSQIYVTLYGSSKIERWDLRTRQRVGGGVDLSHWSDADGAPEATYLYTWGDRVVVLIQQLDTLTFQPKGPGYLVPIDPQSDAVQSRGAKKLKRANPFTEIKSFGDSLCLGEAGVIDRTQPVLDGGIECFDSNLNSRGLVVEEATLGGDIGDFEILDPENGVALVGTPQTKVIGFNPKTGKAGKVWLEADGFRYSQLLADRERKIIYATDRDLKQPSIRVFRYDGTEIVESRIKMDLPPFRMVLGE